MADPALNLQVVDEQLKSWEAQVGRIKANLDVLQQTPSYAVISGGLKFTGRTQQEVVQPILAARELADQYDMLAGHVAKARLLRDSLHRFFPPNRDTLREIDRLLNQPCIPLPATQITLARRNLLDDPTAHSNLSLAQVVGAMAPAFAAARDAVTAYDQVMAEISDALNTAQQQLSGFAKRAADVEAQAELERAQQRIAELRRQAFDDPVAIAGTFGQQLRASLQELGERLSKLEAVQAQVRDALERAQLRQARAATNRALDPAQVADLAQWLDAIKRTLESGQYAATRVGLQRWAAAADAAYAVEEQRQEQLGLLKALRAMAQQRRERGATLDPGIDALALEAESALHQRPADLVRASQLVEKYQRAVTAQ